MRKYAAKAYKLIRFKHMTCHNEASYETRRDSKKDYRAHENARVAVNDRRYCKGSRDNLEYCAGSPSETSDRRQGKIQASWKAESMVAGEEF